MNAYIFTGPTLSPTVARKYLKATYLGPAAQGDILRLLPHRPSVIGIVDGVFQFEPSIWHKEILVAMQEGVQVLGAASMGALRAAELTHFGMIGVGEVFERFRSGKCEDDDEVAVTFAPRELDYRQLSEAMVDIRDVCRAAASRGVIDEGTEARIVGIAKQMYFPTRDWGLVEREALSIGVALNTIEKLRTFRNGFGPSLKQRDAIALLKKIKSFKEQARKPAEHDYRVEDTIFLERLRQEVNRELVGEAESLPGGAVDVARKKVLLGFLAAREISSRGLSPQQDEIAEMVGWFRQSYGLDDDREFAAWLVRNDLQRGVFERGMHRFACVVKMEEITRAALEPEVGEYLRLYNAASNHHAGKSEWLQVNLALRRDVADVRKSARGFFRSMLRSMPQLTKTGQSISFHFVRKHPDIRLRFHARGTKTISKLSLRLEILLSDLKRRGFIDSAATSVYEPEYRRFGGMRAMAVVHDYFHVDSVNWIRLDQIRQSQRKCRTLDLVCAVLNDLFWEILQCPAEVWDVWHNLHSLTEGSGARSGDYPVVAISLTEMGRAASPEERLILRRYRAANRKAARELNAIWESGELSIGVRSLLPVIAMFQCNRYGLDGSDQAALAKAMIDMGPGKHASL